jgi:plasmid stability protein
MPGSLSVRNLDDALLLALKRRAAAHGRSAEAEVRGSCARHWPTNQPRV